MARWSRFRGAPALVAVAWALVAGGAAAGAAPAPASVSVEDSGLQVQGNTTAGHSGHRRLRRLLTLDSGKTRYAFQYGACAGPGEGDVHVVDEGYLGMPGPSSCNWYHGGFLFIAVNGKEIGDSPASDTRVLETGPRGACQMVFDHADATVTLRLLMPAGANHVLADVAWKPKPEKRVESVSIRLTCYPSYFTGWNKRQGDRHCATPRIDKHEPETLDLVPDKDTYLYYYDGVFDMAKGEGEGPCALLFAPDGIRGGRVRLTDYPVFTELGARPEAGHVRLAFYDFHGLKNAEAQAYLKEFGARDLARLAAMDFRPEPVRRLQVDRLKADAARYLAAAGEDGAPYRPKVETVLSRVAELKAQADAGDGKAEGELATLLVESGDLFWKLRIAALLNGP